jgi:hypothetical protein
MNEVESRARQYVKDERLKSYFISKARKFSQVHKTHV